MALPASFLLRLCCFAWLGFPINLGSWASRGEARITASVTLEPEAEPWPLPQPVDGAHSSRLLLPLFKVLSGQQGPDHGLQPDSRVLHYMKKLYKTYATKEGIPKPTRSHLYNTVRLFTPHSPKKHSSGGPVTGAFPSADLLFNLGRVAAVEHLLRSVLLYAFSSSSALRCACSLAVAGPESAGRATFRSQIALEKNYRWVELDVTSLLQPLVASNQRSVHLSVNFTCRGLPTAGPLGASLRAPPSLVLYLNDTSARAHRRRPSLPGPGRTEGAPARRPRRDRENPSPGLLSGPASFNLSEYLRRLLLPRGECELHDFRLGFRQLGWDRWIVAPHRYNPRYCKGDCPRAVRHRYGSPLHTLAQNVIHERLDASVPWPSCVPAAYAPLSVLTVEPDASIAYKEYENMIATRCTCR